MKQTRTTKEQQQANRKHNVAITPRLTKFDKKEQIHYLLKNHMMPNVRRMKSQDQAIAENHLMHWLSVMRDKLKLVNENSNSKRKKTQILEFRIKMWIAVG